MLATILFVRPWPLYVSFGIPVLAVLLAWNIPSDPTETSAELRIRVAGAIITSVGVALVAYSLIDRQREFGRPSLRARLAGWFRDLMAVFRPRVHKVSLGGTIRGQGTVRADGFLLRGPTEGAGVDQRLAWLEADMKAAVTQLAETKQQLQTGLNEVRRSHAEARSVHERELHELRLQI